MTTRPWSSRPRSGSACVGNEIPRAVRKGVRERDEGRCLVCGARMTEIQHRVPRRTGGHRYSNLMAIDRTCHRRVHADPPWAEEFGFTVRAATIFDPADVPLRTHLGWLTLDDEGGFEVIAPRALTADDLAAFLMQEVPQEG